jgi:hypothetical protein
VEVPEIEAAMIPRAGTAVTATLVATILLAATATTSAAKDPPARACSTAFGGAQQLQRAGHLREARELLRTCARSACGSLQKRCASDAAQLTSDIAMIAPVVTDETGAPLIDVQVKVDGELLTTRLDGRAFPVDPGVHELSFSTRLGAWPGHEVATTRKMMIVQGQRGPISVTLSSTEEAGPRPTTAFAAPAEPTEAPAETGASKANDKPPVEATASRDESPTTPPRGGPSAFTYLLGGVGLLGLGAGGLLTYWGKSDNDALSQCSPNCQPASVDHVRTMYLAADISFGVGAAAVGVAALLFATSHSGGEAPPSAATKVSPLRTAYFFDVQPARSGAFATVSGAF